jgi:hypothetical protein
MLRFSSKKIKFPTGCGQVLKGSLIEEGCPGTILGDFNVLLNYIKDRDCPLTPKHQLPISLLPEINAHLSHPIRQGLRRSQQKSYPHINPAPERTFREGTHIFKVSLERVWYRIAIPEDQTLEALASAILDSVEFDNDHLYQFSYKNRCGALNYVNHPYMEEGPWTSEVLVGDLPLRIGQSMTFLFDFGEKWKLDVVLEQVNPDMDIEEPSLLELNGKPPEQYPG